MTDGRVRAKMDPPRGRGGNQITAILSSEDYRVFYELVMARGTSGAETIRQLIREEWLRSSPYVDNPEQPHSHGDTNV